MSESEIDARRRVLQSNSASQQREKSEFRIYRVLFGNVIIGGRIARRDGGQTMQNQITIAIITALAVAFITATGTCQCVKSRGELRAQEAQKKAEEWENKARAYAETLEREGEARRRAEQSTHEYLISIESAEGKANAARQSVEEMRKSASDCKWLNERLPDGVRDVIRELYKRSDCN